MLAIKRQPIGYNTGTFYNRHGRTIITLGSPTTNIESPDLICPDFHITGMAGAWYLLLAATKNETL